MRAWHWKSMAVKIKCSKNHSSTKKQKQNCWRSSKTVIIWMKNKKRCIFSSSLLFSMLLNVFWPKHIFLFWIFTVVCIARVNIHLHFCFSDIIFWFTMKWLMQHEIYESHFARNKIKNSELNGFRAKKRNQLLIHTK